jgi:hypothetical protein
MTFLGFVDDAGHFALDDKAGFRAAIAKFKGQEVAVTVKRRPRMQGPQQLRYYRGVVIPDIATACGYPDPDEYQQVHEGLAWKFLRLADGPFGEPRRRSTSKGDMSLEELTAYIDRVITWAETSVPGCTVRRPEDVNMDAVNEHNVSEVA